MAISLRASVSVSLKRRPDGGISILDDSLGIDWRIPTEHANLSEKLGKIIETPLQHVNYDMSKYDWDQIADEVGGVYQGLKK